MITNRQGNDRVSRKRKMPLKPNVIIWSNSYTVWNEHNYFCDLRKKPYRDLDKTYSSIEFVEKTTNYNNTCDSLPDWLNKDTSSSDDDDSEEVFNIPSLAKLLKMELERDIAREKNDKYKKKRKLNEINPAGSMHKKSRKVSSDNLQSDLSSLFTENNSETCTYNRCSINGISSFQRDTFVNIIDLCPVDPPFDWIHIIYLCIKNSSREFVTCVDVQKFCRYWFPYYLKTSWIRDIQSTLIQYTEKYFYRFTISVNSCDLWTVNKEYVIALETILMSVVEKDESQIKSSMNQPDKLSLLLKGYGVLNLGYGYNLKNY